MVQFGVQFFPDVKPEQKTAEQYFRECLAITEEADKLGYTHCRIVEHYFHYYGGYSPNPIVFLAAASQRAPNLRMITGAVLPVFNNPLKLAGEIAMLDAISGGRLDVGFARAFLPHEFRRFGISPNESKERFREGIEQIDLLLREEDVTHEGKFHVIRDTTSLPRPTQKPRPKFYVAALSTNESFEYAGRMGYSVMAIPMVGAKMTEIIGIYRDAWKKAGHPGKGEVMLAFHMFCAETNEHAWKVAREPHAAYLKSLVDGARDWTEGLSSTDYPGYDKMIAGLEQSTPEKQFEQGGAWFGTPDVIRGKIDEMIELTGGFEHASLQINFNMVPFEEARRSMRLFATEVMPHYAKGAAKAAE